jgi:hypothetical protein
MDDVRWESGIIVQMTSGGEALTVVGYDSVGSVICQGLEPQRERLYVSPSLLTEVSLDRARRELTSQSNRSAKLA